MKFRIITILIYLATVIYRFGIYSMTAVVQIMPARQVNVVKIDVQPSSGPEEKSKVHRKINNLILNIENTRRLKFLNDNKSYIANYNIVMSIYALCVILNIITALWLGVEKTCTSKIWVWVGNNFLLLFFTISMIVLYQYNFYENKNEVLIFYLVSVTLIYIASSMLFATWVIIENCNIKLFLPALIGFCISFLLNVHICIRVNNQC